jgi:hypothetical protein
VSIQLFRLMLAFEKKLWEIYLPELRKPIYHWKGMDESYPAIYKLR